MAAAGMVGMAVGDERPGLGHVRIDPGVGRPYVETFGKRLDPGTETGHRELYEGTGPGRQAGRDRKEQAMDLGGGYWAIINIVGPLLLAAVLLWVLLRNRRGRGADVDRTEQATRDLYREEEERRR